MQADAAQEATDTVRGSAGARRQADEGLRTYIVGNGCAKSACARDHRVSGRRKTLRRGGKPQGVGEKHQHSAGGDLKSPAAVHGHAIRQVHSNVRVLCAGEAQRARAQGNACTQCVKPVRRGVERRR